MIDTELVEISKQDGQAVEEALLLSEADAKELTEALKDWEHNSKSFMTIDKRRYYANRHDKFYFYWYRAMAVLCQRAARVAGPAGAGWDEFDSNRTCAVNDDECMEELAWLTAEWQVEDPTFNSNCVRRYRCSNGQMFFTETVCRQLYKVPKGLPLKPLVQQEVKSCGIEAEWDDNYWNDVYILQDVKYIAAGAVWTLWLHGCRFPCSNSGAICG